MHDRGLEDYWGVSIGALLVPVLVVHVSCEDPGESPPARDGTEFADGESLRDSVNFETASGGDADTGQAPTDELTVSWDTHPDECGPAERRVEPERPVARSVTGGTVGKPTIAWTNDSFCRLKQDGSDENLYAGGLLSLGSVEVDGERASMLLTASYDDGSGAAPTLEALAALSPSDGSELGCRPPPLVDENGSVRGGSNTYLFPAGGYNESIPFETGTGTAYMAARAAGGEHRKVGGWPPRTGVLGWNLPGDDRFRYHEEPMDRIPSGVGMDVELAPNGQLLVNWEGLRILSFDYETGELYWVLTPEELGDAMERFGFPPVDVTSPFREIDIEYPGDVILNVSTRDSNPTSLRIDHCGNLELPYGSKTVAKYHVRMALENHLLLEREFEMAVYDTNEEVVSHRPSECPAGVEPVVTLGPRRFACLGPRSDEIEIFDVEGSETRTISLPDLSELTSRPERFGFTDHLVAASGDTLIATALYAKGETDEWATRVYFVDAEEGTLTKSPSYSDPGGPGLHGGPGSHTPVVTFDGTVIFNFFTDIVALDTELEGLANGPYPRGDRGGNQNLGYVDYAPE